MDTPLAGCTGGCGGGNAAFCTGGVAPAATVARAAAKAARTAAERPGAGAPAGGGWKGERTDAGGVGVGLYRAFRWLGKFTASASIWFLTRTSLSCSRLWLFKIVCRSSRAFSLPATLASYSFSANSVLVAWIKRSTSPVKASTLVFEGKAGAWYAFGKLDCCDNGGWKGPPARACKGGCGVVCVVWCSD